MQSKWIYGLLGCSVLAISAWVLYNISFYRSAVEDAGQLEYVIHERNLGDANAPVVLEEYSSFTCGDCGIFYQRVMPVIKKKFVETGKVYFKWKHFPHDGMASVAAALSNLVSQENFWLLANDLYGSLGFWYSNISYLKKVVSNYVDSNRVNDFMNVHMREVAEKINRQKDLVASKLGVSGVPAIFINGTRYTGGFGVDELTKAIEEAYDKATNREKAPAVESKPADSTVQKV